MKLSSSFPYRRAHLFVDRLAFNYRRLSEETIFLSLSGLNIEALLAIVSVIPANHDEPKDPQFANFLDFTLLELLGDTDVAGGLVPLSRVATLRLHSGPRITLLHIAAEVIKSRHRVMHRLRRNIYRAPAPVPDLHAS